MAPISSALTGTGVNTDRIAVSSRQRTAETESAKRREEQPNVPALSFRREVPMPRNDNFVEADGKRYYLNAPRGTYVNIVV